MAVHQVEPSWPTLDVPRMHPCEAAGVGPGAVTCGATPASLWERSCGTPSHTREARLCGSHAAMTILGLVGCRECLARGAVAAVTLRPLEILLAK
jgi:hypothetical protein